MQNKSTFVAEDADTQLGSSCVLAPLATNVDLWKPIPLFHVDHSQSGSMTDVQEAIVTSQTINNGGPREVRQTMC